MNMKQRFRNFVGNMPIMLERRKYMALYSGRYDDETPLPKSVNNFLNMVPTQFRSSVLKWIMTEGMRKASNARRFITDQYNKKYGLNVGQDQIFSTRSYTDNPQLAKLKDQLERDWFDHDLEPRYIRVRGNSQEGVKLIDAYQINSHLEDMGLEPMYFGGPNGLMEIIEKGEWVTDQIHSDSRDDKQGHDLSLAPGDVGVYRAAGKEIERIKQQMRDAEQRGESDLFNQLNDKLKLAVADARGSGNITKLGLGQVGYVPSIDDRPYTKSIERSVRDSRDLIHRLYNDIKAGATFDDLDGEEAAYVQSLHDKGLIDVRKEKEALSKVMGVIKRQLPPEDLKVEDPQNIMYSKAIVKAVFKDLLSRDPSNPGNNYKPFPRTNPALGPDSTGFLPPAKITVASNDMYDHSDHKMELDGPNKPTPQNIDAIAEKIADWIVDDEKGVTAKRVRISRGYPRTASGTMRYTYDLDHDEFFAIKKGTKSQQALENLGDQPIEVNFRGERHEAYPQVALDKLSGVEQTRFGIKGKSIDPMNQGDLVEISPDELKGYEVVGKNTTGNVLTYKIPHTNIKKKVHIRKGPNGETEYWEYKPAPEMELDADIKNPQNTVKEFGGGKYARITYPDGRTNIARRSVKPNGDDIWYKINPARDFVNTDPLLQPLSVKVNAGLGGLKPQMRYSDEKTHAMWHDFLDNAEAFGEPSPPKGGMPEFVRHAMAANRSNIFKGNDDPSSMAALEVMNQIAAPEFKFGDFKRKTESKPNRKSDVYDLLAKTLSPEEIDQVVPLIKRVLFGNPGGSQGKRTLVPHDAAKDDRLFVAPNSVRSDIYDALIKNGYDWRVRKAASSIRSLSNKDSHERIAVGQGGEDSDEAPSMDVAGDEMSKYRNKRGEIDWSAYEADQDSEDLASDDDRYDDYELYSADDQDDILAKRGEDEIDPSLAGLSQIELDPSSATVGAHTAVPNYRDKVATPQGTKRDLTGIYASKVGDEDQRQIWVGRQRQSRADLKDMPAQLTPIVHDDLDDPNPIHDDLDDIPAPVQRPVATPTSSTNKPRPNFDHSSLDKLFDHAHLKGYAQWLSENEAIHDPKVKIKDGCGFNWWGAAGDPLGVSISGKADTSKSDPTGKNKNGKSRTSGK